MIDLSQPDGGMEDGENVARGDSDDVQVDSRPK